MSVAIDQKAYLQKYLSGKSDKKKKKKRVVKGKGLKIIDDDIDISKLRPLDTDELDFLNQGEDAPQIAGIIDERPEDVKKFEQFNSSSKWRVINQDDGFSEKLQVSEVKKDVKEVRKENEIIFGKMYSDSEDETKNDSDLSPVRKPNKNDDDLSPPRKRHHESKEPKKAKEKHSRWGPEQPTSSKRSELDESPPRKNQQIIETSRKDIYDTSVSSKKRRTEDFDIYPLDRKESERRSHDSSSKPQRRKDRSQKHDKHRRRKSDSDSDLSPARNKESRKNTKNDDDSDLSPVRKRRILERTEDRSSDSPPPSNKKMERNLDERKVRSHDAKQLRQMDGDRKRRITEDRNSDSSPPQKRIERTLEGKKAGLQDARQLRKENEKFRQKEDEAFKRLDERVSGRNAQIVSRKYKRENSEERSKQIEKAKKQKELDEKYKLWSRGLKQVQDAQARLQDFAHESSKPLARHKGDRDLEESLKNVEREGDPMLQYIRDKKRERGELAPEKPTYKGNFPPNRYNIRPGYRWDGVDRSNGYESKYFKEQSKRKAQNEEAYKWSTEDL